MIFDDGTRFQEIRRTPPAMADVRQCNNILLGIIQEHGIFYSDNGQNPSGMTLLNISLLNGWPDIYRVPVLCSKINRVNGESIDPEPGDQVVVAFLNGNFCEPVVIGFLPPPGNSLQPKVASAPLHHTHWQGTDIKLEKDGTRRVHVAKDDLLNVVENQTETIGGTRNVTVHIDDVLEVDGEQDTTIHGDRIHTVDMDDQLKVLHNRWAAIHEDDTLYVYGSRDATIIANDTLQVTGNQTETIQGSRQINVGANDKLEVTGNGTLIVHGNLTVHVYGTTSITSNGNTTVTTPTATVVASTKVTLQTPSVECTGDITASGKITANGDIKSTNGEVGDKVRNMSGDRTIYNSHKHLETGVITYAPNNQQ